MKIFTLGIDYRSSKLLLPAANEEDFIKTLVNVNYFKSIIAFMGELIQQLIPLQRGGEEGKSVRAGWTYIFNPNDPCFKDDILKRKLKKLGEIRGMEKGPIEFAGKPQNEWFNWFKDNIDSKPINYFMLVGGPKEIPYGLQSLLSTQRCVGRIAFDNPEGYIKYIDKVIALEDSKKYSVDRKVLLFATDHGSEDPTHYFQKSFVDPLSGYLKEKNLLNNNDTLVGETATNNNFRSQNEKTPALVFVVSHGVADVEDEKSISNGGIYCPLHCTDKVKPEDFFGGEDVVSGTPCFSGSVFFQLGCYGYGVPSREETPPWISGTGQYHKKGFVSLLPRKLLAHENGPIAYIGHVDAALLNGSVDRAPAIEHQVHKDYMAPFTQAIEKLIVNNSPVGVAIHALCNISTIMSHLFMQNRNNFRNLGRAISIEMPSTADHKFREWVKWNNTRNFMLFGDPGARLVLGNPGGRYDDPAQKNWYSINPMSNFSNGNSQTDIPS